MQSHLDVRKGSDAFPSAGQYASGLKIYAELAKELNLDLQVTELDATLDKDYLTDAGFQAQAKYYSDIMDAIVKYKDCISAVVFWGTTDDQSWRVEGLPLLFNEDYSAKPCFKSIIDGIEYTEQPATTARPTTTKTVTTTTAAVTTADDVTTAIQVGPIKKGDITCDGAVDVADAVLIARYIAEDKTAVITDQGLANADIDGTKGVADGDLTMVLKAIAKIIKLDD